MACGSRLRICSVGDQVWGVILVTGLDKLFEFQPDVAMALAALGMREGRSRKQFGCSCWEDVNPMVQVV